MKDESEALEKSSAFFMSVPNPASKRAGRTYASSHPIHPSGFPAKGIGRIPPIRHDPTETGSGPANSGHPAENRLPITKSLRII